VTGRVLVVTTTAPWSPCWRSTSAPRLHVVSCASAVLALEAVRRAEHDVCSPTSTCRHERPRALHASARTPGRAGRGPHRFGSLETAVGPARRCLRLRAEARDLEVLAHAVEPAASHKTLAEQVRRLSEVVERAQHFEELLGESEPMQHLFESSGRWRGRCVGAPGGRVGHRQGAGGARPPRRSRRSGGPFVALSCAALPETLLEPSSSAPRAARITDARKRVRGSCSRPTGARCSSTRWATCPSPAAEAPARPGGARRTPVGGGTEVPSTCASSAPRTATSRTSWPRAGSGRTCSNRNRRHPGGSCRRSAPRS